MKSKSVFTAVLFLVFCVNAYGIEVSVPQLSAQPGDTVTVEISVDDVTGVAGGDITLLYDLAILEAKEVRPTDLAAGLTVVSNIEVAGQVTIAMMSVTGLAGGSGALLEVDFEAKVAGESPLTLSEASFSDETAADIPTTAVDGSVTVEAPGPEALTPEELLAVHQASNDAINAHDAAQYASYFTDDGVFDYVPAPPPASGKEEIAAFVEGIFQGAPDFNVTQRRILVSGNIVATECTITGTHQGEWMGIPGTGNSLQLIHMDIMEFEGDKIKRVTTYDDAVSFLVQTGIMPAPEPLELVPSFTLPDAGPTGLAPLEAAAEFISRWNAHDLDSYAKMLHPDADLLVAPLGVPLDRDAYIAVSELYFLAFSDIQQETVRLIDMEDGWVVAEVVFAGTNDGPYFGIPATGNSLESRAAWLGRFDADGLATNVYVYWDRLTGLAQLGLFPPPPDIEANKTIERRVFEEIWNQGALDVADEIFAPDCVIHNPPSPDAIGPEAHKAMVVMYRAAAPDVHYTIEDQVAEGDMVATRWTATGTFQGEFMGIPPTGGQMMVTGISIARIADGKIQESWNNTDQLGMMQQMGVIPPDREDYTWGVPSEVTGDPGDPEANKAIARRAVEEIWNQRKLDVADEVLASEYVYHFVGAPEIRGPEGFKQMVAMYLISFPDIQFTIEDMIAEGDKVALRWTGRATHKGEFMGMPPTGRQVTVTGISIARIADGKVVEGWTNADFLGLIQQFTAPPKEIETGSLSFDVWLQITQQFELTPEERADGLYLVVTTPVECMGDFPLTFDATGDQVMFKATLRGEFQELKVNFDETGAPVSATGPARGSAELLDADGNVAFYGTYMLNQTLHLAPDLTPMGANPVGYSAATGVGDYAGCHLWLALEGSLAPNPQNPEEMGYAFAGRGELTKQVIAAKPPTGHHVSEAWFRYTQDYGLVPEQRADGLYLVSTRPAIVVCEYTYIFDIGEEITGNLTASGTHQELKVVFDDNGVPIRAVGSSYGGTTRGSDSYGNIIEGVLRLEPNVSLSPDMQVTGVTAKVTVISHLKGKFGNYISTDRLIVVAEPDPKDPTKMVYHGVGDGVMAEVTGLGSVGTHSMQLTPGLNMVSLPLKPVEPHTARSFAEELGATVVIRYDEATRRYRGFTPAAPDDGFAIEAGKGYIVNVLKTTEVEFMGTIWGNVALHEAAPPARRSAWAFVVSGSVLDGEMMSARDGGYILTAKNLRTGATATEIVDTSGYFAAVWADLNRNAVIQAGDEVEVAVTDSRGDIVSGPFVHDITLDGIRNAVIGVQLRLGDIIPEKSVLLQNYPNPFNPETWIPFHLSDQASVSIRIYSPIGQLIRTLDLGHNDAGVYVSRSSAAYWDAKNEAGEEVASGIYFYSITAGDFSATRKMVIKK